MEIKSNIPIPPDGRGRPRIYPFDKMEVGDSFDVSLVGEMTIDGSDRAVTRVRGASSRYSKDTGTQFRIRTIREEGVGRCWRVA